MESLCGFRNLLSGLYCLDQIDPARNAWVTPNEPRFFEANEVAKYAAAPYETGMGNLTDAGGITVLVNISFDEIVDKESGQVFHRESPV